jgi:hypothetical protein
MGQCKKHAVKLMEGEACPHCRGEKKPMKRATFLAAPQIFNLNNACQLINHAFDATCYLVGSCLETKDYRDVDVRIILDDEVYDATFPGPADHYMNAKLSLMNAALSEWLTGRTGLPVDFQFQRRTDANAAYGGRRNAMGLTIAASGPR